MVKIYLHIGTAKTGTTTMQRFLCKNEKPLLDMGYLYPKSGRPSNYSIAHYNLANEIRFREEGKFYDSKTGKWKSIGNHFSNLHKEIDSKKASNVIISCENFGNDPNCIANLKQELSRYDVKVLVYLRPQSEYLPSSFCESIKQGSSKRINRYINEFFEEYDVGNYYKYLLPWKDSFGQENIIVRIFKKEKLKGNLFEDFLFSIGISDVAKFDTDIPTYNTSPPAKVINLLRFLNFIFISTLSIPYHICRKVYLSRLLYSKKWQAVALSFPNFLISNELIDPKFDIDGYLKKFELPNSRVASEYLHSRKLF